jgi:hypothetical protein
MTTQEDISKIQVERDEALRDLRAALSEASAKVELATGNLRPNRLIQSHPVAASIVAGGLGFLFGANAKHRGIGPLAFVALLGFALSKHSWANR